MEDSDENSIDDSTDGTSIGGGNYYENESTMGWLIF